MLEGYGLHNLTWDACDERFNDMLVASPADSCGRGIALAVRQEGAAADMTGATVYLAWKHKATGVRGTEPFEAVDAAAGTFSVFYPAVMCEAAGPCRRRSSCLAGTTPTSARGYSLSAWSRW